MRGGVGVCLNGLSTKTPADPRKNRAERRAATSKNPNPKLKKKRLYFERLNK